MGERIDAVGFQSRVYDEVPLSATFGFEVVRLDADEVRVRMPFRPAFARPGGTVSGPALMALADVVMYGIVTAAYGWTPMALTTNISISFLNRPPPATLLGIGTALRAGRSMAFCEVEIRAEADDSLVAHVTGAYALPR